MLHVLALSPKVCVQCINLEFVFLVIDNDGLEMLEKFDQVHHDLEAIGFG